MRSPLLFPLVAALVACQNPGDDDPTPPLSSTAWEWELPPGFPLPRIPEDNPMTVEKVTLGRHLFYDERLSGNGTLSCAGCHDQARAFSDGEILPEGSTGDVVPRNAMALVNLAWYPTYTWPNPLLATLEDQAVVPMFGEHPVELGMTGHEDEIYPRFQGDELYQGLFAAAFPGEEDPVNAGNIVKALASFERTLVSGNSAYDRYFYGGEADALSESAKRGLSLFFSEKAECYHCHSGVNFTTAFVSESSAFGVLSFFNTGLYNIGGDGSYPIDNPGLKEFTGKDSDEGKFRTPTLRNVELTAPYMHDGSVATLEDVIEHYNAGGRTLTEGPYAGVGSASPYKDPLVRPMNLTDQEKADLIAFMKALTDVEFTTNPAFSDPFAP